MATNCHIASERSRCADLVQALLDSLPRPTALRLVITAEKMFAGPLSSPEAIQERQRCIAIVDTAAMRPFESKPAVWALGMIRSGARTSQGSQSDISSGTPTHDGDCGPEIETTMASDTDNDRPLLRDRSRECGRRQDHVGRSAGKKCSSVRDAALETGINLVNTALGIDTEASKP